jgi:hypothetical protein
VTYHNLLCSNWSKSAFRGHRDDITGSPKQD